MIRTLFFSAAVGRHRIFVLPYVFSVLEHNADAAVEVMVEDAAGFLCDNAKALDLIGYKNRILFTEADFDAAAAPYMRFLRDPTTKTPYVYMGDVDILVLDGDVTDVHIENSVKLGLPYSNIVRPSGDRLSGLHFTRRDAYYPVEQIPPTEMRRINGDEHMLMKIVQRRGLGLPTGSFRPVHGIHMSLNRTEVVPAPDKPMSWGLRRPYWEKYKAFARSPRWKALRPMFAREYQDLLAHMEREATVAFEEGMFVG